MLEPSSRDGCCLGEGAALRCLNMSAPDPPAFRTDDSVTANPLLSDRFHVHEVHATEKIKARVQWGRRPNVRAMLVRSLVPSAAYAHCRTTSPRKWPWFSIFATHRTWPQRRRGCGEGCQQLSVTSDTHNRTPCAIPRWHMQRRSGAPFFRMGEDGGTQSSAIKDTRDSTEQRCFAQ